MQAQLAPKLERRMLSIIATERKEIESTLAKLASARKRLGLAA